MQARFKGFFMRPHLKVFSVFFWMGISAFSAAGAPFKVMITQIVEHPALNAVREGALAYLKEKGYKEGKNLTVMYENAQGHISTAKQIAHKFSGERPSVILAISTPSAQSVISTVRKDVPVVFSAITDPVEAKLLENREQPEANVTGVTDKPPFDKQFQFMKKLLPNLRKIGVIYNPGEANSLSSLKEILKLAQKEGLEIVESTITNSADVGLAAQHLVDKVDALYIPNDNKVVSGLESILQVGHKYQLPVFTADVLLVARGAAPMIGVDYHQIGRQTGRLMAQILEGKEPSKLPVEDPEGLVLKVNEEAARKMHVPLPQEKGLSEKDFLPQKKTEALKKTSVTKQEKNGI